MAAPQQNHRLPEIYEEFLPTTWGLSAHRLATPRDSATVSPNIQSDGETWLAEVAATPAGANARTDVEVHHERLCDPSPAAHFKSCD
jgi:hypothetical protein